MLVEDLGDPGWHSAQRVVDFRIKRAVE